MDTPWQLLSLRNQGDSRVFNATLALYARQI